MNTKIIDKIFKYALDSGANSLDLENGPENITLNYILPDGDNCFFNLPKKLEADLSNNLRQILKLAPDEFVKKKYCKIVEKNFNLNFLLTIQPTTNGDRITIKIIQKNNQLFRLNQLGLESGQLKAIKNILNKRSGLIVISSPSDQGKSTTLNALINELDKPDISLYFLGHKIDHEFSNLSSLANNKNNWNKITTIDSDAIVCEIESRNDWLNIIRAANSGRLIIATIKANSVWEVMDEYLKLKIPLKLKLTNLKLILNQRVVSLKRSKAKNSSKQKVARANIGVFEYLEINKTLKDFLISEQKVKNKKNFWQNLITLAKQNSYHSLQTDFHDKKRNGLI